MRKQTVSPSKSSAKPAIPDIQEAAAPSGDPRRCGISEATSDAASGFALIRGWVSDPTNIASIFLEGPGGESLGEASLTLRRVDISAAQGRDPAELNGFAVTLDSTFGEGAMVWARFVDAEGNVLTQTGVKIRLGTVSNSTVSTIIQSEVSVQVPSFVISEAVFFGRKGDISVRGWTSMPQAIAVVRLRIGNETLGVANLEVARPDVSQQLGMPLCTAVGFVFAGNSQSAKLGQTLEATFIGSTGRPVGKATRVMGQSARLTDLMFAYDFESRQLRLSGCVFPERNLRAIAVNFTKGRVHFIRKIFQFRPGDVDKDPFGRALYSGFIDRIPHVGEGDVRTASLDLLYTDGSHHRWFIPPELVQMDLPEAAVEQVAINWMQGDISIKGWLRSRQAVTGIELQVNGQTVYGVPQIAPSERIQKLFGFRGRMAQEFKLVGEMNAALQHPDALYATGFKVRLRLMTRDQVLHEIEQDNVPSEVHIGRIGFLQFDRRNNVFHASGEIACPIVPTHAQLLVNERPIDVPLPVQISAHDGMGYFSWTHEVNAAMQPGSTIVLRFQDGEGRVLGTLNSGTLKPLFVVGHVALERMGVDELATNLSETYVANSKMSGASICFVMQGRIDTGANGGGLQRLVDLMQSFHKAGYATVLIDRSEPWTLLQRPAAYRQFREICDLHLMVPQGIKYKFAETLAKQIDADHRLIPPDFKVRGKTFVEALRSAGEGMHEEIKNHALVARIDPVFNMVAAALVNILMPKAVISTYAWSGGMHDFLRPGIHGMIDTIDVQALRAEVFRKARVDFGTDAVPDPSKFDVELDDELKLLAKAASLIAISREEQAYLVNHINPAKVVWAGVSAFNGVALPHSAANCRQVLFVGNAYEPNIDGIRKFIIEQWPTVLARVPDARLVVAGKVAEIVADLAQPSLELLGIVHDLRPIYEASAVALNPIRFGTGTSVKLVETLSMGRALVTTPVGARGFEKATRSGALKVAEIDNFASAVADLLLDNVARWIVESVAIKFAETRLASGQVHVDLFNHLESKLYYN